MSSVKPIVGFAAEARRRSKMERPGMPAVKWPKEWRLGEPIDIVQMVVPILLVVKERMKLRPDCTLPNYIVEGTKYELGCFNWEGYVMPGENEAPVMVLDNISGSVQFQETCQGWGVFEYRPSVGHGKFRVLRLATDWTKGLGPRRAPEKYCYHPGARTPSLSPRIS